MKKLLISIFAFCLAGSVAQAQEETTRFHEIGLNATPFVSQYLDFNSDDNDIISPYVLTYERRLNKIGFRLGIGVVTSTRLEQPDDDSTEPKVRFNETRMAVRGGGVLYKDISKRFSLKYGLDAYFMRDMDKSITTTTGFFGNEETTTISSSTDEYGLSPFLFLQLHVTPNFSIGTELLGRFSYSLGVEKEENTQFPEFNDEQKTKSSGFRLDAPTSLFFILRF